MSEQKAAIILAAGKGKRMKSNLPKVLHLLDGRPMITILLDTLSSLSFDRIVVVIGHEGEQVQNALTNYPVKFVWQREQLGTGHAVKMAAGELSGFAGVTLVAAGDVPLLTADTISGLMARHADSGSVATCLSALFTDPTGYGRIIREGESDRLAAIVEEKDASEEIKKIDEINSGTFCFDNGLLFEAINEISNDNAQGEYYLTDVVKILHDKKLRVSVVIASDPDEVSGVNSIEQLDEMSQKLRERRGN